MQYSLDVKLSWALCSHHFASTGMVLMLALSPTLATLSCSSFESSKSKFEISSVRQSSFWQKQEVWLGVSGGSNGKRMLSPFLPAALTGQGCVEHKKSVITLISMMELINKSTPSQWQQMQSDG